MIYDRTAADVVNAKNLRLIKVQKGLELTAEDIEVLERGTMTINTLNRIESKQTVLKNLLNNEGYYTTPITNKTWEYTDIFDKGDFQRIIDNCDILKRAFFERNGTPDTPGISFDFETINSLEKIIFDIDVMINDVKSCYRQCGTFQCGEVNGT